MVGLLINLDHQGLASRVTMALLVDILKTMLDLFGA